MPSFRCRCLSWTWTSLRSFWSRAPSGSSSRSTSGSRASARASATRWRCPPESSCGLRFSKPESWTSPRVSRRARACAAPVELAVPQAEGDVLLDGEVREEGVVLEHHVDGPQVRRRPRHVLHRGSGGCPRSGARSHRSSGGASSCRSPRDRGGRRTRPSGCRARPSRRRRTSPKRFVRPRISTLGCVIRSSSRAAAADPPRRGRPAHGRRLSPPANAVRVDAH